MSRIVIVLLIYHRHKKYTSYSSYNQSQSQNQSYTTTVGQSTSLSWVSGTHLAPATNFSPFLFNYILDSYGFVDMGALSDERPGLDFTVVARLASKVFLESESRGSRGPSYNSSSSYIATDGQSASSTWGRGTWPDFNCTSETSTEQSCIGESLWNATKASTQDTN
jgi:hypothetical protein